MSLNTAPASHGSRLQLFRRRKTLLGELLGVDRLINATAPIHQLPDEVLAEIFLFSLAPNRFPWQLFQTAEQRFLVLLVVCVRWRSVICTVPRFWRDISVRRGHEWLNLSLSRCSGAPTNIFLRDEKLAPSVFVSILPRHSRILRSIHATDISQSSMPRLLTFIYDSNTPNLHSLSIRNSGRVREIRLSAESLPALRQLTLNNFLLPPQSSLYSQLHVIVLTGCQWFLSMSQFLDILEATSRLTKLVLDDCGFPLFPLPMGTSPLLLRTRLVQLPCLSTFMITTQSPHITQYLLAPVRAPSMVDLTIQGTIRERVFEGLVNLLVDLLPSDPWTTMPLLNTITSVAVRADSGSETFGLWASGNGCKISLSFPTPVLADLRGCLPLLLRDLNMVFSHASMTHLTVEGDHDDLTSGDWAHVFRTFPLLEEIVVGGYGSHASMWEALRQASENCPGLKYFKTDLPDESCFDVSDELFDTILDTLRSRARRGMRLEGISLAFDHDFYSDYERYFARYVKDLRSLVKFVEYTAPNIESESDALEVLVEE